MRVPLHTAVLVALALAASAPAVNAQVAGDSTAAAPPAPSVSAAGDVALDVVAVGGGLGARFWINDIQSVGLTWDRTAFERRNPAASFDPFFSPDPRTWRLTAAFESGGPVAWSGRVSSFSGVQVNVGRQADDVLLGHQGIGFWDPVVEEGGRRAFTVGAGMTVRSEVRVAGPLTLGAMSGLLGVQWIRTVGGAADDDGRYVVLGSDEVRSRWALGGPTHVYLGVRF